MAEKLMKTLICEEKSGIRVGEIPIPKYSSKQALVKTIACGICNGTDAKLIYWVPNDLPALDVSTITGSPVAAFGAMDPEDGQVYYMAVYAHAINWQDYIADQQTKGADTDTANLVIVNGIQVISLENPEADIDYAIVPATDDLTIVFAFYPLNNEVWDQVKSYIVSSIQLAQ